MPEVSVLMPCFNAAETLADALQSLSAQTLSNFEILAVDDGSQDLTLQKLRNWQDHEPRLRVISSIHQGIVKALNTGLADCRGALVARMDADDRCDPTRLEKQASYLRTHPEIDVLACQVRGFPNELVGAGLRLYLDWQNALLTDEEIRRDLFIESPLVHPSVMMSRKALEAAGGYEDHGWAEDYDLWLRLAQAGNRFARLPEVLLDWRESGQRLTRLDSRYSLQNFLRAKAHYLKTGPLLGRENVFIWGAGMIGRRLGRLLVQQGTPVVAYLDIDPTKIGNTRHGRLILDASELPAKWGQYTRPIILAAVGMRGARQIIRKRLTDWGFIEGKDWWAVA